MDVGAVIVACVRALPNNVPIIGWDYMEQREKDGKFAKGDMEPKTLVGFDRERKWMTAEVVPHKGVNPYAVKAVSEEIENSGYSRIILKSDQEASIKRIEE